MTLNPALRKLTFTAHVIFSVGWIGAVSVFLALAIAGLARQDSQVARSFYITMEFVAWFVIVPFNLAALFSGLVQSLGTKWGLLRHYWILVKFLLTIAATVILLVHLRPISQMAEIAARTTFANSGHSGLQIQLIADATAALAVLLVATVLSVYKPWGKTPYGLRKGSEPGTTMLTGETILWTSTGVTISVALLVLALLFIVFHIAGGGLHGQ